jgi:RNA-directed DNA polymerase
MRAGRGKINAVFVIVIADINSYGFRPKRSCADAIERCFKILSMKRCAQWVLECDIKSCFDEINHIWLLNNAPMDRLILKKWLNAGYIEKRQLYSTTLGVPQGGLCKALHKPPYAKKVIMRSNRRYSSSYKGNVAIYFA